MQTGSYGFTDPIAAIATALSPSALGIVRTSGAGSIERAAEVFVKKEALLNAVPNTVLHGWIVNPVTGKRLDEVTACVYRAPKSFTGEDSVEFICHGGVAVVVGLYYLLLENGFRAAEGGEFTFRAFINGKTDLTRAEAVHEIINAETETAAERAAKRLSGGLVLEIARIKELLLTAIAAIDVQIEYPEDEKAVTGDFYDADIKKVCKDLQTLCSSWQAERVFREASKVVIAGKTNAGKSSLFNALLKEDRAIVSDVHGTTRDWIEAPLSLAGIPVHLYDTAGFRYTADEVEAIGIERSMQVSFNADLILYLIDSVEAVSLKTGKETLFTQAETFSAPIIFVFTKPDLLDSVQKGEIAALLKKEPDSAAVSSKTAEGIKVLCDAVFDRLVKNKQAFSKGTALGSARQKEAAEKALQAAQRALSNEEKGFPFDLIIEDLEEAVHFLGEITGEVYSDDILSKIFSNFCVGK